MNKLSRSVALCCLLGLLLVLPALRPAAAAVSNPSPGSPGYQVLVLPFSRTITATATPITFKVPFGYAVVAIQAHAAVLDTSSGNETYTVDVKEGTTSLLASAISLAAQDTVYAGTLSTTQKKIPDEATVTVVVTLGGTSPSLTDLTVMLVLKRL